MRKLLFNVAFVMVLTGSSLYFQGCYPDSSLTYEETDIALTGYYDSVDFTKIMTYYMPDTVFPFSDDTTNIEPIENQDVILNQVANNMQNYGYTRVNPGDLPEGEFPDVQMTVSAIVTTTVSVGWWYPYYPGWGWGWYWWKSPKETSQWYPYYPGYYPPGWGWGGIPYYSSYTTGTLMVEMANPEDYRVNDGDTVVPLYWAGGLNGVLSGSSNVSRVEGGIDQLFIQSPYLNHN